MKFKLAINHLHELAKQSPEIASATTDMEGEFNLQLTSGESMAFHVNDFPDAFSMINSIENFLSANDVDFEPYY